MVNSFGVVLIRFLLLSFGIPLGQASLNLFLKHDEVLRLLGLKSQVYYVKDGQVNDYALKFEPMIPAQISDLYFTWQSIASYPIPYSIGLQISDLNALNTPTINIPSKGLVPNHERTFRVLLPCSGRHNSEVEVQIFINVTMSPASNITTLNLRRRKICLKNEQRIKEVHNIKDEKIEEREERNEGSAVFHSDSSLGPSLMPTANPLYIGVGCASGLILLLSLLSMMCYVKSQKRQSISYGSSTDLSSKHGHSLLKIESQNNDNFNHNILLNKTGHYSSYHRLATVTSRPSLYRTLSVPVHINSEMKSYVERRKIVFKEKLKEGTFGQLYNGIYIGDEGEVIGEQKILIKTISDQASHVQISVFLNEGKMMRSLNHDNILSVMATCTDDPIRPLIIYPWMNQGNLKLFLQKCKVHTLFPQDKVQMAIQIAQGLNYLHKRDIIHRDLATRNCAVHVHDDGSILVKITDNALARDLFPDDYHCLGDNENRPVKWMAVESLMDKEFSPSSDIWMYGVLLWELMTLGQQPYNEVDPFEMADFLKLEYRLYQPSNCPDNLYDLMFWCWKELPDARPTLTQVISWLEDFYKTLVEENYV